MLILANETQPRPPPRQGHEAGDLPLWGGGAQGWVCPTGKPGGRYTPPGTESSW